MQSSSSQTMCYEWSGQIYTLSPSQRVVLIYCIWARTQRWLQCKGLFRERPIVLSRAPRVKHAAARGRWQDGAWCALMNVSHHRRDIHLTSPVSVRANQESLFLGMFRSEVGYAGKAVVKNSNCRWSSHHVVGMSSGCARESTLSCQGPPFLSR